MQTLREGTVINQYFWFVHLAKHMSGDKDTELAEMLDLEGNVNRDECTKMMSAYISINDSHPNIFQHVEAFFRSKHHFFPYHDDGEVCILAAVDVNSRK